MCGIRFGRGERCLHPVAEPEVQAAELLAEMAISSAQRRMRRLKKWCVKS